MQPHAGHRERMRQKYMRSGPGSMTDAELAELMLYPLMPRRDVRPLAEELISAGGGLSGVASLTPEELAGIKGAGEDVALLIKIVGALSRRAWSQRRAGVLIRSVDSARRYLSSRFRGVDTDLVLEVCIDRDGWVAGCAPVCSGPIPAGGPDTGALVLPALRAKTDRVILAHNILCIEGTPEDLEADLIAGLDRALGSFNIVLLDYFIFYGDHCISAVATHLLPQTRDRREYISRSLPSKINVNIRTLPERRGGGDRS